MRARQLGFFAPPLAASVVVGVTLRHPELDEPLFVASAYWVLLALVAAYVAVRAWGARGADPRAWARAHVAGLVVTGALTATVLAAVAPSFRVLADEANLVGVSKNLFFHRTANFALTGKWYFENYWNLTEYTDRRPALFPFLVNLVHVARGYRPENAFVANAALFAVFVFTSYRLARSLGGEAFGVAAAILVAVSPNTLVAARSAGFDFLATLLLVVVVAGVRDHLAAPTPRTMAVLALHLLLLAHVRYEGWAILVLSGAVLAALRRTGARLVEGFAWLYALAPLFLLPRYFQLLAKAHDAEQPLSASLFSAHSFVKNVVAFLRPLAHPLRIDGPHSPVVVALGLAGCALFLVRLASRGRRGDVPAGEVHLTIFVASLVLAESVLCFSYAWGDPQHAASARLFLWLDTFLAFAAAWLLVQGGRRLAAWLPGWKGASSGSVAVLACAALFAAHLPVAAEARFINTLILTRQTAQTYRFLDSLGTKRILVLSDRPGLFTIKDYGAMDIAAAAADRSPLVELSRHLYDDVYLIQEADLDSGKPLAAFAPWPDVETTTVFEFQNTESTSVRIARVKH